MKSQIISTSYLYSLVLIAAVVLWSPVELQAQTAAETALQTELIAAAGDEAALAAIIARETGAGNVDGLASALASASTILAATDIAGAAALVIQAVEVAAGASEDVQLNVGEAASVVATTAADNGNEAVATTVETSVATSAIGDLQLSYIDAGGAAGTGVPQTPSGTTGTAIAGAVEIPPVEEDVPPPGAGAPPPPIAIAVPVIVEPNPSQSGSPT